MNYTLINSITSYHSLYTSVSFPPMNGTKIKRMPLPYVSFHTMENVPGNKLRMILIGCIQKYDLLTLLLHQNSMSPITTSLLDSNLLIRHYPSQNILSPTVLILILMSPLSHTKLPCPIHCATFIKVSIG